VSNDLDVLTEILTRYISAVNARALVLRAMRENGVPANGATRRDLRRLNATLRHGVTLFVAAGQRDEALRELARFYGDETIPKEPCSVRIRSEADVGVARSEARRLCDAVGTDAFTMQKVTTIVSELARNIVLYADKGTIELGPAGNSARTMLIKAVDEGPGIPNLEHILSGNYKSKTGLGRGLAGTKRLADRFDVKTGQRGTTVLVEVTL
jgi:serine/threonine-protein kinase RsbT